MSNRSSTEQVTRCMKLSPTVLLCLALVLPARASVVICCNADNDLFRLLPGSTRVDTPNHAIGRAANGSAVLILADGYPQKRTELPGDLFDRARAKQLRLYVEYPP